MGYKDCPNCNGKMANHALMCRDCRQEDNIKSHPVREEISSEEIAWVAGILEGEGCWTQTRNGWSIQVGMSDKDIIERLKSLTAVGHIYDQKSRQESHKAMYTWHVFRQHHREWLTSKVWPWLGERRRARIKELWHDVDV